MASRIENTPACIEIRLPQTTRAKLSRPRSSVPNGCVQLGALRIWLQSVPTGSVRAIHGARRASTTNRSTITPPTADAGRRSTRRQPRRSRPAGAAPAAATRTPAAALVGSRVTADADARIQQGVRRVDEQVDQ